MTMPYLGPNSTFYEQSRYRPSPRGKQNNSGNLVSCATCLHCQAPPNCDLLDRSVELYMMCDYYEPYPYYRTYPILSPGNNIQIGP